MRRGGIYKEADAVRCVCAMCVCVCVCDTAVSFSHQTVKQNIVYWH